MRKLKIALNRIANWIRGRRRGPDDDPYAGVRSPVKRSPPGRASSVALAEPD